MDYLWRKVSKDEEEKIKKEAKLILDKFSKSLEKVEKEIKEAKGVQRDIQLREESKVSGSADAQVQREFKKAFFKNSPKSEDDFIMAEKGAWKP